MLSILISIVAILVTIMLVIGVHEFGHYITARLLGIKVLQFSIGFGKDIKKWRGRTGIEYRLAAIPLGGYVKMLDENEGPVSVSELPRAYNRQSFYKKFLIVSAGPVFNFLFAFILYWFIFVVGFTTIKPIIGTINPHSIAAKAGLRSNEEIIAIDNQPTISWYSVLIKIVLRAGEKTHLVVTTVSDTSKQIHTYTLSLANWKLDELNPDPIGSLGIEPYFPTDMSQVFRHIQYNPIIAISHAYQQLHDFIYLNIISIKKIFTGQMSLQSLGGPITIFAGAGNALNQGIIPFLSFLAFLSIAIGMINVIPIPGLDGGHILFQLIEVIIRRPLPEKVLLFAYRLGFLFLIFLIIQAFINDIMRI